MLYLQIRLEKNEFINELLNFCSHQITCFYENKITPFLLLQINHERYIKNIYPKIEITFRIFVSTPASNCTTKRSYSVLKRMKIDLRSTMSQN